MKWIGTYSHNGKIGVLIDIHALKDSIRKQEILVELCRDIAFHIAASDPADIAELLNQPFAKNPDQSVSELLNGISESVNNPISITRFIRWDTSTPDPDIDPQHDTALALRANRV